MRLLGLGVPVNFNPRFPRGKRLSHLWSRLLSRYFNPRFPRGKRPTRSMNALATSIFQSTLPAREATFPLINTELLPDISIHASREGSDPKGGEGHGSQVISIHASREGSDFLPPAVFPEVFVISIHASREGSDVECFQPFGLTT